MDAPRSVPAAAAICIAVLALFLIPPPRANAGYAMFTPMFTGPGGLPTGATVDFRARPGEVNTVTVSYQPGATEPVLIHDATTPITDQMLVAPTCSHVDDYTVRCGNSDPLNIVVDLGDLDDSAAWVGSDLPATPQGRRPWQAEGGAGNDFVAGSDDADNLADGPGDDLIQGLDGADSYFDSAGNDTFLGGPGADGAFDGPGSDVLDGGEGDDRLTSQSESLSDPADTNTFIGGDGRDGFDIYAVGGSISADGGAGPDRWSFLPGLHLGGNGVAGAYSFAGGDGADTAGLGACNGCQGQLAVSMDGGADNDTLAGGGGPDTVTGGEGNDGLSGGPGVDTVEGGPGDDNLTGGEGDDALHGSDGNDVLRGDAGSDSLLGEAGDDRLDSARGEATPEPDALSCGDGNDATSADATDSIAEDCEGYTAPVDCPAGIAAGCSGEIELATAKPIYTDKVTGKPKKKIVRLAKAKFVLPPSAQTAYPVAALSKKGRKLLNQRGKLRIRKTVTTQTQLLGGGTRDDVSETVLVIRAPG